MTVDTLTYVYNDCLAVGLVGVTLLACVVAVLAGIHMWRKWK